MCVLSLCELSSTSRCCDYQVPCSQANLVRRTLGRQSVLARGPVLNPTCTPNMGVCVQGVVDNWFSICDLPVMLLKWVIKLT